MSAIKQWYNNLKYPYQFSIRFVINIIYWLCFELFLQWTAVIEKSTFLKRLLVAVVMAVFFTLLYDLLLKTKVFTKKKNKAMPSKLLPQNVLESNDTVLLQDPSFHLQLKEYINSLILHHFEQLVSLLYRIDVSEAKIKLLLQQQPGEDAAKIIASLIIERQLQKIKTRQQFSQRDNDFDGAEKW